MADRTEKHAGRDNNSEDDAASRLVPGLYEQVISHSLAGKLSGVPDVQKSVSKIDEGEAAPCCLQKGFRSPAPTDFHRGQQVQLGLPPYQRLMNSAYY